MRYGFAIRALWATLIAALSSGCISTRQSESGRHPAQVPLTTGGPYGPSEITATPAAAPIGTPPPVGVYPPAPHAKSSPSGGSKQAPAQRYGSLDRASCLAELTQRKVPFSTVAPKKGVEMPIQLAGPVHGVTIRSAASRPGKPTVYDVLDCRLALSVTDLAAILSRHDVVEVVHFSFYRPGARIGKSGKPSQHSRGLAFDIGSLQLRSGTRISVEKDWKGDVGDEVQCPSSDEGPAEPGAKLLLQVVCEAAQARLFNLILTPNYNQAHFNHFHLDLQPGRSYFDLR